MTKLRLAIVKNIERKNEFFCNVRSNANRKWNKKNHDHIRLSRGLKHREHHLDIKKSRLQKNGPK